MSQKMLNNLGRLFVYIILFLTSTLVFSMPEDRDKIAQLSADSADLNQQTHKGEYVGNVQFDQGTTHLRSNRAITEGNQQNKLSFAVAYGDKNHPAHYWTQTAADKPLLHAYAIEIRYYPDRHFIELIGNARVVQGENSLSGPKITYDTVKQHVVTSADGHARTTIIFHPGKKP